jgi:streptogramin lyase
MRRSFGIHWLLVAAVVSSCAAPDPTTPTESTPAPIPTSPSSSAAAPADPTPEPSDAGTPLADRLEAEIEVPGSPDWPQAGFGSIWVLAPDLPIRGGGTPNLVRIDPVTNEVIATIPMPDRLCQGFVVADDGIWVCTADALVRVDPATNEIASSVPVKNSAPTFYQPAFGGGMVWALGSEAFVADTVIRLDPATKTTTPFQMSGSIGTLVYGIDALWLTIPGEGSVVRMDPVTGETRVVATGLPSPRVVAVSSVSLWVSLHGGQEDNAGPGDPLLARIDPASGEVLKEFDLGGNGGPQYGVELWAGEGGVLVRSARPWLMRIDEVTDEILYTITAEPAIQGPVTFGFGSIWTTNIERDTVFRIAR